jgi:hypothetical protein
MQEYKRERNILESRVEELDKKSAYHDDHLRIVDAWWTQVRELPLPLPRFPLSPHTPSSPPNSVCVFLTLAF